MPPSFPIIIAPSPLKIISTLAIASVGGFGVVVGLIWGMALLATPWPLLHGRIILICTAVVLASYCAIALAVATVWGRPRVEIGAEGFIDFGATGSRSRRWSDIDGGFVVIRVAWQPKVRLPAYRCVQAIGANQADGFAAGIR